MSKISHCCLAAFCQPPVSAFASAPDVFGRASVVKFGIYGSRAAVASVAAPAGAKAKGSGYDFIYLLSTSASSCPLKHACSSLEQVNGRLGAVCGEHRHRIHYCALLLLLSTANPTFDFPTGSGTLMAGVVQETETPLDDSVPAMIHGGPPQIKQALCPREYGRQGGYGNSGAGVWWCCVGLMTTGGSCCVRMVFPGEHLACLLISRRLAGSLLRYSIC
ncbi:hypothetical protein FJTKL_02818 [Diaporthe vaccinii]|uniref:Uncharacterized protein n=1 Tax=Diaporthe vaccinii TaxID=105482 RepID=A0ABR4F2M6_9PEZI